MGLRQRLLRRLDSGALAAADIVIVDTEEHRSALPDGERQKAVVVAVGAAPAWFVRGDAREEDAPPQNGSLRVVFFGLYTPLHGAPVIGAALAELARDAESDIDVTMIGTGQDLDATRELAGGNQRVTWRDWVAPTDLPAVVAAHHVCLGIFGTSPKALRVVPNKVFQGAAAGCAIVTSDTPPQRRSLGDAGVFVPPGNATALAAALRELARDRGALQRARSSAAAVARQDFTAAAVAAPLAQRLEALP
jgi:glycosyltransferase involved in cell wall biosynthesis